MRLIHKSLLSLAAAALGWAAQPALADDVQAQPAAQAPLSSLYVSSIDAMTIGITPAYGSVSVASPAAAHGGLGVTDILNYSSEYTASLYGGSIGLFGDRAARASLFAPISLSAWNMGGSFGYAGFYLRAGLSATPALGPAQRTQGWQAGLGFAEGAFDVRLTFLTAQSVSFTAMDHDYLDSQQWTLGGIYRLSNTLRLNADAFYGLRDSRSGMFFTPQPAAGNQAPQGTGARVGIQLRF